MIPLYTLVVRGFVLEHHKQFQEAISAHQVSITLLQELLPKIKKAMRKAHRVMFERQLDVLRERKAILDQAALTTPPFVDFIRFLRFSARTPSSSLLPNRSINF